jgi:SRSO17 transposase
MLQLVHSFAHCFKTKSAHSVDLAARYVGGLLSQTQRKNMERMDERLGKADDLGQDVYQATQNFISTSRWEVKPLYAQICEQVNRRLGGSPDSVLAIDESALSKKGDKSVGVGRQHNGRLGKLDNCQMGVFSALTCGSRVALIGSRLYLPEDWINDPERCQEAGVPAERMAQGYLSKIDHARELILEAVENGVQFSCIAMDAFYGRDSTLRRSIEELGLIFCVDVPTNTRVFRTRPTQTERPKKITEVTVSVAELAQEIVGKDGPKERIDLREGDHGIVEAHVSAVRVWEWSAGCAQPEELWLLIRAMPDGSLKLSLCNADSKTPLKQLARWQAARFWVERCFQDAKSHCGMGQYQARGWWAWQHHIVLVALAILFEMEERMMNPTGISDLTATDVTEMIEWALITKPTEGELIERMMKRHQARERSKQNALVRQAKARESAKIARS